MHAIVVLHAPLCVPSCRRESECKGTSLYGHRPRSPVLAERQDTRSQTHSVPGNIHFPGSWIEVRPAVQFLTGRTEVIPAQAIVQRQLPRHSPVIRDVNAILVEPNARKGKGVVMPDGFGI